MKFSVKTLSTTALALMTLSSAWANETSFTGASIGGNLGYRHSNVDFSGYLAGRSTSSNKAIAQLEGSYGIAMSEAVVLSVGATYDLNSTSMGNLSYNAGSGKTANASTKLKQHWSLYLAPGYRVAKDWLVYGKLGYHRATVDYTDSVFASGSTQLNGVGYGVGAAYAVARNVELGAELQRVNFNSGSGNASTGKPSLTELIVKAAYRF